MTKVVHVLFSSKLGGAEQVAINISENLKSAYDFTYFSPAGPIQECLADAEIDYRTFNPKRIFEFVRTMKATLFMLMISKPASWLICCFTTSQSWPTSTKHHGGKQVATGRVLLSSTLGEKVRECSMFRIMRKNPIGTSINYQMSPLSQMELIWLESSGWQAQNLHRRLIYYLLVV